MKRYILFLFAAFIWTFSACAQKPEPVLGFARQQRPLTWYHEQKAAWKKVTEKEPKNALAWYYYYYSLRCLMFNDTNDTRTREVRQAEIDNVIEDMGKQVPESYEYNVVKWVVHGFDFNDLAYLKKADELGKDRTEHLDAMINWGELERNIERRNSACKRKYAAGDVSPGMMYYNYNVMSGLAPNAILITAGDNDTYPVWTLQAQGIREDITVINLSLLQVESYRNLLFRDLGIEKWAQPTTETEQEKYHKEIIAHIAGNKKNYPVYIALTASGCDPFVQPVQDKLYLTGLAYCYSNETVDNMALMKRNFDEYYTLDYIGHSFYLDASAELVQHINQNYAIPMLKLFDHYKLSGDTRRAMWIREKLLVISKGMNGEKQIREYISGI